MGAIASSLLKIGAGATAIAAGSVKLGKDLNEFYAQKSKQRLASERKSKTRSRTALKTKVEKRSAKLKEIKANEQRKPKTQK